MTAPHIFLFARKIIQSKERDYFFGVSVTGDRAEISLSAARCGGGKTLRREQNDHWIKFLLTGDEEAPGSPQWKLVMSRVKCQCSRIFTRLILFAMFICFMKHRLYTLEPVWRVWITSRRQDADENTWWNFRIWYSAHFLPTLLWIEVLMQHRIWI